MLSKKEIENAKESANSYIRAIDTFGIIDYKCINNLYTPIQIFLQYIEELEADNYEANNIINEYIEERQKLINKLKKEKLTIESTYSQINGDYFMAQDRLDLINELLEIVGGEHE